MKSAIRQLALLSVLFSMAAIATAQETRGTTETSETSDPSETARFHWGPLRFTPSIVVNSVGVDTNVFNEPTDPKQDTTAAAGPAVNLWLHPGRARVSGKASGQYLYFKTYGNQRSWNTSDDLKFEFPMARLKPFAQGSYINSRERPGFEIDSRSRAATNQATIGTALRLTGKTTLVLSGSRTIIAFDQKETFLGAALANALNRRTDTERLQLRYELTPLTTLVVNSDAIQDRFEFSRARNGDSIRVMPGFEFKPFALISGTVAVGVRHFNALNDALPDFNGVVAGVNAKYVLSSTMVRLRVDRDLDFSYEAANPYYASTAVGLELTERLNKTWDVIGKADWNSLAYRQFDQIAAAPRTDVGRGFGLGTGYRLGETLRLGIEGFYSMRRSVETARQYDGLRVGASVSYGLAQ